MIVFSLLLLACSDYSLTKQGESYDVPAGQTPTELAVVEQEETKSIAPGTITVTITEEECVPSDELCDGIDNDCDGYVDEGEALDAQAWYADVDGDGYGGTDSVIACAPPLGYVEDSSDCDDTYDLTNPGAEERCDFEDNDCDGLIETQQPEYSWMIYHDDDDDDGFGSFFGDGGFGCSMSGSVPEGHARSGDDCNDQDSATFPGSGC